MTDASVSLRPTESLMAYLERKATDAAPQRAFEVAANQLDKILSASTIEEMWDADEFESVGARDLVDAEIQINSFDVIKASEQFNAPLKHYIVVYAQKLSDGEEFVFNTGAPLIIGKLRWLEAQELLPVKVVIRGTDTPNGTVLKLKPIPERSL